MNSIGGGCQKNIKLLDPNITACKNSESLFEELVRSKACVDFSQGIDVRMLTDKHCDQLNRMKVKMIHVAWDNYEFKTYEKLKQVRPLLKYDRRRLCAYVLTNFNTTHEQDLERIRKLREIEVDPYVMIYDKANAPIKTRHLQRWCNNKIIFRSCEFSEYDRRKG